MSSLHRQQLAQAVAQLKDGAVAARDRLLLIEQLTEEDSDTNHLIALKGDLVALRNGISCLYDALHSWQAYAEKQPETERSILEETLAAVPTYWDEIDQSAQEDDWPTFKLIARSRQLLNKIEAFFLAQEDSPSPAGSLVTAHTARQKSQTDNGPPLDNRTKPSTSTKINPNQDGTTALTQPNHEEGKRPTAPELTPDQFISKFVNSGQGNPFQNAFPPPPHRFSRPTPIMAFDEEGDDDFAPRTRHTAINGLQTTFRQFRLEPPKFDGDPKEWGTFWLAFRRSIHDQSLPKYEKHLCLLQSLTKGSAAWKAIDAYPPSDANYPIVVKILQEEFGDESALREKLVAELLQLPVAHDTLVSLRTTREHIERICLQLQTSDPNSTTQDEIVCGIIRSKLPERTLETLLDWELQAPKKWTLSDLRNGLSRIVIVKKRLEQSVTTLRPRPKESITKSEPKPDNRYRQDKRHNGRPEDVRNFVAVEATPTPSPTQPNSTTASKPPPFNPKICSLCEQPRHRPFHCPTYPTAADRLKRLREQKRCFICLRQSHLAAECDNQQPCGHCGRIGHNIMICFEKEKAERQRPSRPSTPEPASPSKQQPRLTGGNAQPQGNPATTTYGMMAPEVHQDEATESPEDNTASIPEETQAHLVPPSLVFNPPSIPRTKPRVVMMTRTIMVSSTKQPYCQTLCPVVLDTGCESNYITRRAVDRLKPRQVGTDHLRVFTFACKEAKEINSPRFAFRLLKYDGTWLDIELNMVEEISGPIPTQFWGPKGTNHRWNLPYVYTKNVVPEILLGIRGFWKFILHAQPIPEEPSVFIVHTIFGPVMGGEADFPGKLLDRDTSSLMAIAQTEDAITQTQDVITQTDDDITHDVITQTLDAIAQTQYVIAQTQYAIAQTLDTIAQTQNAIAQPHNAIAQTEETIPPTRDAITQTEDESAVSDGNSPISVPQLIGTSIEHIQPINSIPPPPLLPYPIPLSLSPSPSLPDSAISPGQINIRRMERRRRNPSIHFALLILALFSFIPVISPMFPFINCWPFSCPELDRNANPPIIVPKCDQCRFECTDRGVAATATTDIQKMEICCAQSCLSRPSTSLLSFHLPMDSLVIDYECDAWFWANATHIATTKIKCPAIDSCQLFDCWFCTDHLQNPTCNKQWATVLYITLICTSLLLLSCLLSCCRSLQGGIHLMSQLFAFILFVPLRLAYKITGRPWTQEEEERVAARIENGTNRLRRRLKEKSKTYQRKSGRLMALLSGLALIVPALAITTITSQSENCHRNGTNYSCTISATTTLTLLPAGQHNTLLIRDEHGLVVATLDFQLASLTLDCLAKTDAWLRSYRIETTTVKRCPRAGSCFGDHCSEVLPSSIIPELRLAQNFPGHSHCAESNPFWGTECGLPASACIYFRNFARPTSSDVYELFSCPGWSTRIVTNLIIETNSGQRQSVQLNLHPGIPKRWGNITLTPLAISLPPLPILNTQFIADGNSVAIANNLPLDLQCPTAEDADSFNCSLSLDSCQSCVPDHSAGTMDCLCRDLDLDQLIEDPSTRLPLNIAKLHIRSEGTLLFAQHEYSPVQIAISIHELSLVLEAHDSKCWITPNKLVGCYRCSTGAQFSFTCRSNLHTPLAKVECSDGTLFVAHCSPNGTENTVVLPFSNSDISTKCLVDCPSGETSFNLNGTLYFVPLRRQTGHQTRTSDNGIPDPDGSRPWYNPFGDFRLLWFANNWPWLMAVFLASAFALYIFILLNPILRTYRLILRLAVAALLFPQFVSALNPDASAQNPEIPPPTTGFLLIAYGTLLLLFCCLFLQYRHKIRQIAQSNRLPF